MGYSYSQTFKSMKMLDTTNIQETFFSANDNNTFNFVILYKNGEIKKTVKKFNKVEYIRKDKFDHIASGYYKKMTCNHFQNYLNDYVEVYNTETHFIFVIMSKGSRSYPFDMCFSIKK